VFVFDTGILAINKSVIKNQYFSVVALVRRKDTEVERTSVLNFTFDF